MGTHKARHPKALSFLFLTEMWERYGFYIVQGLLILYMTEYFKFSDNTSYAILGVFTALVYISPILGGLLADKLLGFNHAVFWGGFFLILGYAMLTLPSVELFFYPALATIILGTGLFKPNVSSLLGMQYSAHDIRRDSAFTIFYIGINMGIFLAGTTSGYVKEYFGWRISFLTASIGLMIGLATFAIGLKHIKNTVSHSTHINSNLFKIKFFLYCVLAIISLNYLLRIYSLTDWLLPGLGIALLIYLTILTLQQHATYRKRMFILNMLIVSSVVYWMLYMQMFFSANLFINRLVDKQFFGFHLSTTLFYASESIFIILLGPFFAWLWHTLSRNNNNPSPMNKFIFGILFAGLGFLLLAIGIFFPNDRGLIYPIWVILSYLLITIGELLLSPIGLAAVTLLAPPHLVGMMMGIWLGAIGFGGVFAGWIAKLASVSATAQTLADKLAIYQHAFFYYAYIAFFMALLLFIIQLVLKKVINNLHEG
jgi:POT family proton-dependent oligopeptide transporter